jgi:hypothetical protein
MLAPEQGVLQQNRREADIPIAAVSAQRAGNRRAQQARLAIKR